MRSRTSRGLPEWFGDEDLYMGSPYSVGGSVRGYIGIVPGPPKGFRGSTGRVHLPRRALWAEYGGEPAPRWAGCQTPRAHVRLGLGGGTLKGAPPWQPPPSRSIWRGPAPLSLAPINRGEVGGQAHHIQGAALSLPNTSSSSVVLGEALPENCKLHHHAVVLPELSLNFSSPLAGSRRRRRPRAVCVLNAEAPSVRH